MDPTSQRKRRNTTTPANIVASGGLLEPLELDLFAFGGSIWLPKVRKGKLDKCEVRSEKYLKPDPKCEREERGESALIAGESRGAFRRNPKALAATMVTEDKAVAMGAGEYCPRF
ncbi:hypothetical protein FCM35_KLT14336 [Carex littledalei]|uniref:Uncharacterized protein n=1 Tax=Carex littledalei TaxID=544730 RepID=A0A833QJA8_9POAL|nr:hypothetical protein FCM35_KLT14336 [Carex littledalei]